MLLLMDVACDLDKRIEGDALESNDWEVHLPALRASSGIMIVLVFLSMVRQREWDWIK